jgi:hypothetical protein
MRQEVIDDESEDDEETARIQEFIRAAMIP